MSASTLNVPSAPNYLFVYGTLMTGESRHHLLGPGQIKSITPASLSGELVNLETYPGLRFGSEIKGRVQGELIELEDLDKILTDIDEEEGPAFRREIVNVPLDGGDYRLAYTYVFASDVKTLPVIPSGDWRNR